MTTDETLSHRAAFVAGILLGGAAVLATVDADKGGAYDRGRADGIASCSEPSRLERAAKWLAK